MLNGQNIFIFFQLLFFAFILNIFSNLKSLFRFYFLRVIYSGDVYFIPSPPPTKKNLLFLKFGGKLKWDDGLTLFAPRTIKKICLVIQNSKCLIKLENHNRWQTYTVHILYITTCPSGACSWQLWYRGDFLIEFPFSFSTLRNLVDFCFSELRAPDIQPLLLNLTSINLSTACIHSEINLGPFQLRMWNLELRSEQNWVRSRTQNMLIATRASLAA